MSATSLDLSQIKTDALSAAASFRTLIGLGSGNTPTFLGASLTGGTVTASTPLINATQTWNSAGTVFTGIVANVTDTASSSSSLLMDLQTESTTRFRVWKDGSLQNSNGALALSTSISFNWVTGPEFRLTPAAQIVWATTNATSGGNDLVLVRDAAQTLAQRNAGNAQRFNLYGTYTDASNYRRLFLSSTTAGAFTIGVEGAGTGASGNTLTVGNDLKVPSLSTSSATLFNAPAGYHVFYDGQSVLGFVISHINYDPDTAVFINSSNNVLSPQGVFAFGNGTYWQSDVVLKRTSANTISVLRGNFSTPGNFVSGTTSITPASLTGSSATSALDIAQTWNTTGTPTLIKANVTDTASNASSLLMDLQVGGSSRFQVLKTGPLRLYSSVGAVTTVGVGTFNGELTITNGQAGYFNGNNYAIQLRSDGYFGWSSTTTNDGTSTIDTRLYRDAAQTLAQRNAGNAQRFNLYGTYTDASNYRRLYLNSTTAGAFTLGVEGAGTGASGNTLELQTGGTTRLTIGSTGAATFSGNLSAAGDIILSSAATGLRINPNGVSEGLIYYGSAEMRLYSLTRPWVVESDAGFKVRNSANNADANITAAALTLSGNLTISTKNIVTDTTTGTKIGTGTTQKLAFWNATPVVQPTAVADATDAASVITQLNALLSRMRTLGLIAT